MIKEGLVKAAVVVDNYLISKSMPITSEGEMQAICKIACNNDVEMAKMLQSGLMSAGREGAFLIEEGTSMEDRLIVFDI